MPNFDDPATLEREARALYKEGKYSAAALTWARSREAARTLGDHKMAFEGGVWSAEAWLQSGDYYRALGLLLPLLSDVPPEARQFDRWFAQGCLFDIQLAIRPERALMERLLADLEALASRQPHPQTDLYFRRGEIAFLRGSWERALVHFSRGWQNHNNRVGIIKPTFAWMGFRCCLMLGRGQDAESWRHHLSMTDQDSFEEARVMLKETELLLSLEAGDRASVAKCVEHGCGKNRFELRGQIFLRGDSLDPLHDPSDPSHPARELARLERIEDVHDRYDNLLALVDYRLSCLRYTAGLQAVDDLYYRQPDALPSQTNPIDLEKLRHQTHLFDVSWRWLKRHARRIDDLLECDWRTLEVEARRQRCEAIAAVCGVSFSV